MEKPYQIKEGPKSFPRKDGTNIVINFVNDVPQGECFHYRGTELIGCYEIDDGFLARLKEESDDFTFYFK